MIAEERKNIGLNNGCFFLIFRHIDQAQDALKHQDAFRRTLLSANNSILSEEQKAKYNVAKWRLQKAPASSDVRWAKIGQHDLTSVIKSFFLYLLLFVICVLLVSPLTVSPSTTLTHFL
jgi:hypothetical protein